MTAADSISSLPPDEIGDYRIARALTAGRTYLALSPGDRKVVLKMLDSDCLQRGQLHPNIRDRLGRVRELAHRGVANLLGVERSGERVFAVWQYVEGETLDQRAAAIASAEEFAGLAREIILTVQSLHALGIVHGRIHAGNVIIDPLKQVKLTHISALLYDDPAHDVRDLSAMLKQVAHDRGWAESEILKPLGEATNLAQMRVKLSASSDVEVGIAQGRAEKDMGGLPRKKMILGAIVAAVAGIAIAVAVVRWVASSSQGKLRRRRHRRRRWRAAVANNRGAVNLSRRA